jgi:hypothetical protein
MHLCSRNRKSNGLAYSPFFLRLLSITAILCLWIAVHGRVNAESPRKPAGPVAREEFLEMVFLGMPEEQLIEVLGPPDRRTKNTDEQFSDLTYHGRIAASRGAGREDVIIVIFKDYKNVYAIKWADGTLLGREFTPPGRSVVFQATKKG